MAANLKIHKTASSLKKPLLPTDGATEEVHYSCELAKVG